MDPLICALAISLGLGAGSGAPGAGTAPVKSVVQDDAVLLHSPPQQVGNAVKVLRRLGVDRVRLTAVWSHMAPGADSRTRPQFDAENPRSYRSTAMDRLDTAVREVARAGLEPMVDVGFWAPRWATRQPARIPPPYRWRPNPGEFGSFAKAMARRYNGDFKPTPDSDAPLPAVRLWTTWNEPNYPAFLLPQWTRRRGRVAQPASPSIYRRLHDAGYDAIKGVNRANNVLVGGLASDGAKRHIATTAMSPLRFVRELTCVDRQLRPLRRRDCRGFRPLRADGFAQHPYPGRAPPTFSWKQQPENVIFGDLDRLVNVLRGLYQRGRLAQPLPVHITELGWDTNPPDPRGVSLQTQADYIDQASYLAWRNPAIASYAQFLLRDLPPDPAKPASSPLRWSTWQTGLLFQDDRQKPAFDAFRFPFWLEPASLPDGTTGLLAWGQVRPGAGAASVQLEQQDASGQWQPLPSAPLAGGPSGSCDAAFSTAGDGVFVRFLPHAGAGKYRFEWLRPLPRSSVPSPIKILGALPPGPPPRVNGLVRPAG